MDAQTTLRLKRFCLQCKKGFAPADAETRLCFQCGGLPEAQHPIQPGNLVCIYDLKSLKVTDIVILADSQHAVVTDIEGYECENPYDDHGRLPDVWMEKYTVGLWEMFGLTRSITYNYPPSSRNFVRAGLFLSSDKRFALTGGEHELILFDLVSGKEAQQFKLTGYRAEAVCLSPDGGYAMAGDNMGIVWLWETSSGLCLRKLEGEASCITHMVVLSSGDLITVTENGNLHQWRFSSGECISTRQTGCKIQAAVCSPEDQLLFSTLDGSIQQWDPRSSSVAAGTLNHGTLKKIYQGEAGCTTALALTPDGNVILAGGEDGVFRLIELARGQCLSSWQPPGEYARPITCIACSPDGRRTLVGSGKQLHLWEWAEPLDTKEMTTSRPEYINPFKPQPPFEWGAGDIIMGGYEIQEISGWDGAYRYYKVRHLSDGVELTMKSPAPARLENFAALTDYRREADILFHLRDVPQVEKIDQARLWHGIPLLLMERNEGGSLLEFISQYDLYTDRDWLLERVLDLSIQLAWGLSCVHQRQIIHTDVKPANVAVTEAGYLKLYGFKFACLRQSWQEYVNNERKIISGMQARYCSPEQIKGESLSIKTDLWGWALTILEMFTGEVTWNSGTAAVEVLEDYLENGPAVQSAPVMPARLAALLRQCFHSRPEDRPVDMLAIVVRLQAIYRHVTGRAYAQPLEFQAEEPQTVEFLLPRGVSYFELGQYEQAAACLEKAVALDPECGAAWLSLGFTRLCLDSYTPAAALECFKLGYPLKSARHSIGQVAEYSGSIWRERVDCARRVVWIERYYGLAMRLGEYGGDFTPYNFRGVNLTPEQLPGCGSPERWFRHQEREREPWVLEVDKPDELGVGYEFVFGEAPASAELEIRCQKCGIDLAWIANRDRRLQELADRVDYWCQACALTESGGAATSVGPWRLIRRLEGSGSEQVHLAWHAPTRLVAELHRLPADIRPGLEYHRFLRQMYSMRDLHHPNLVSLIDSGEEPGNLYFIQDVGAENSLENLVDERYSKADQNNEFSIWRPLSIPEAISYILPILDGLAYLHEKGYVHRNITPANILRVAREDRWLTLLSGFTFVYNFKSAGMTIESEGVVWGTLPYMSREQVINFPRCQPTVDLFAMGATLYFLLTSYFPLPFPGWREIKAGLRFEKDPIRFILDESAIPIRQRDSAIPEVLAAVIDKAVRKKSEERFQTALELKEALLAAWAVLEADSFEDVDVSDAPKATIILERMVTPTDVNFHCAVCGQALGVQVNCDGRAAEFGDDVMYWCPRCAHSKNPQAGVDQHGYLAVKALGSGIGSTALAWHAPTGRVVVLRRLYFYENSDKNKFQYLEDIYQLFNIANPVLVPLLDAFISGEFVVAVSPYIRSYDLWDWVMDNADTIALKPAVEMTIVLLDGLIQLKKAGWDYHNIHPWNILLPDTNLQRPRLCTADFSQPYMSDCTCRSTYRDPTKTETIKALFLPRERLVNFKSPSPSHDLYGMGTTLYFLLTQESVWNVSLKPNRRWLEDPMKVMLRGEPIPIRQRDNNIPIELAAVIDRAVSRQAEARYPSLEAFQEALQDILSMISQPE